MSRAAGTPDRPALRRCIAVEPDRFAVENWSRRPLLTAGAGPFDDLLTLSDVDELLAERGLRTPFLRIAKDGQVVDAARFTRSGGAGAEIADQVADDRVLGLFLDGSTLVLQGLHRIWPPLIDFAQQLTTDLGHPVQVNAYITPPQNRGFDAHYDVHDVFVLQVAGEKRWVIHPPVLDDPLRDQPWTDRKRDVATAAEREPAIDTVLRPGDALYLPRGWLHAAEALGEVSAHLTIGVQPVTRYQLVETLTALAAADPSVRTSLPLGLDLGDPAGLTDDLTATVAALRDWLATVDPAEVAERMRKRVAAQGRSEPVAPLAQAGAVRELDATSRVRLRGHLRPVWRVDGEHLVVSYDGRWLRLPAGTEPALKVALAGEPVVVGELPGLEPDERLVLVRRLLREAILVPAAP